MHPTRIRKLKTSGLAALGLTAALAILAMAAAACSSGNDPETAPTTSPPSETVAQNQDTDAQGVTTDRVATLPEGIVELPQVNSEPAIFEPTSEDAVFNFLFAHLFERGYTLVANCDELTLETDPDKLCIIDIRDDDEDPNVELFTISQPPPGMLWYRLYVENSSEGSRVTIASVIGQVAGASQS